jgi:hypothetical protein
MKFDLRSQMNRLITKGKTQLRSTQALLIASIQSFFRLLRLRLSAITKLSPQSMLLQLLALIAAALMTVLAIGGLQTIAQVAWSDATPERSQTSSDQQPASQSQQDWASLPTAPSSPTPAKAAPGASPKTAAKTTPQSAQAKPSPAPTSAAKPPQATPQAVSPVPSAVLTQSSLSAFAPRQESALAHPTNYGERYAKDIFGNSVNNDPLIVLHETVGSADSAINMFQTPHQDENLQSSYHSIIRLDGTIVYVVPPEKRAFGAGNSVFNSSKGQEAVRTHRQFPPSVNNFAYHISLETPADGHNDAPTHSGYTDAQYRSLAWLVAHTSVSDDRVTTHRAIDRSGSRMDPRSFDAQRFYTYLRSMPRPYLNQPAAGG